MRSLGEDVGLLYRNRGKERHIYTLHDDVAMAIESYAKKELSSLDLASWHDREKVRKVHQKLVEFYQTSSITQQNKKMTFFNLLKEWFIRYFKLKDNTKIASKYTVSKDNIDGINNNFEACYHKIMLKERFERKFEITREEFAKFDTKLYRFNPNEN